MHQVCGCGFRDAFWQHENIVRLIARNLYSSLRVPAFDIMLDWLLFKYSDCGLSLDQDANTVLRLQRMDTSHLVLMFGLSE